MQQWIKKEVPVDSDRKMIDWYAQLPAKSQSKLTTRFRRRITEVRLNTTNPVENPPTPSSGSAASQDQQDPDFAEFERQYSAGARADKTALADLKKQFQFFLYKQRVTTERNDQAAASECTRMLTQLGGLIHDMELRDQKLGRDLGDLVPRSTLENVARHIPYHLLRCVDTLIAEITAALTRRDPTGAPLTPGEIEAELEPILLDRAILQPIRRAAHGSNPAAPPDWLVRSLETGLSDILENPPPPAP
jgi:hypothetical protein